MSHHENLPFRFSSSYPAFNSLVIPNSATSLYFVDGVWKGIIDKRLLSGGGGGGLSEV